MPPMAKKQVKSTMVPIGIKEFHSNHSNSNIIFLEMKYNRIQNPAWCTLWNGLDGSCSKEGVSFAKYA